MADQVKFVEAAATKNATDNQGNLEIDPKRSTTAGWTSATMVLSSANRKVDDRMERTTRIQANPCTSRGDFCCSGASADFSDVAASLMLLVDSFVEGLSESGCSKLLATSESAMLLDRNDPKLEDADLEMFGLIAMAGYTPWELSCRLHTLKRPACVSLRKPSPIYKEITK